MPVRGGFLREQVPSSSLAEELVLVEETGRGAPRQGDEYRASLLAVSAAGGVDRRRRRRLGRRCGAPGAVGNFVARSAMCLPAAITMVERR